MFTVKTPVHLLFLAGVFLFGLLALSAPANSQDKKNPPANSSQTKGQATSTNLFGDLQTHSFGFGVGQTTLMGDFQDHAENGITLDAYYAFKASYSFDLLVNAHYFHQEYGVESVSIAGLATAVKARFFQFDQFAPYLLGGLGFYLPRSERQLGGNLVTTDSKWVFGTNFGAGIDLKLNDKITVGFITHYHNPFDAKQTVGTPLEGSYIKTMLLAFYTL